jgi:short-subunit dehydrogenase
VATVLIIGASRGIGLETVKADGWSAKVCETLTSQAK